jgi:AAA ATPase domain
VSRVNPFRPGFAAPPPVLAGREDLVRQVQTITASINQPYGAHQVLYGPRGVGKTVLIDRFAEIGQQRRWAVVKFEVRTGGDLYGSLLDGFSRAAGVSQKIRNGLVEKAAEWADRSQRLNLGVYRAEVKRTRPAADDRGRHLHDVWVSIADELADHRRGLMVLIDEAQNAAADHLNMIGPILQDLSRADRANVVVFAGLMSLPRHLVENVSYAERLLQTRLGHLDTAATAHAIAVPARDAGKPFDDDALQSVVAVTGGYPYFVQLYAYHAFEASTTDRITLADVRAGADRAQTSLEDGMFRTRWDTLPASERQFLLLMAKVVNALGIARIADIASAANTTTQQWSVIRARLISKGVIEPAAHGELRCSQPGFLTYVEHQSNEHIGLAEPRAS